MPDYFVHYIYENNFHSIVSKLHATGKAQRTTERQYEFFNADSLLCDALHHFYNSKILS